MLFVDDSPPHVEGARDVGLRAALFVDAVMLAEDLHRAGLLD